MILSILVIVFTILYACCCEVKCQCSRAFLHFAWCLEALVMVLLFLTGKYYYYNSILGGITGILGLLGTDGGGVLAYLFSSQNLNTDLIIFQTASTNKILDVCFNGISQIYKFFRKWRHDFSFKFKYWRWC